MNQLQIIIIQIILIIENNKFNRKGETIIIQENNKDKYIPNQFIENINIILIYRKIYNLSNLQKQ